ncbi:hypothetical protein BWR22_14275 [Lacinutrix venerupis]|uniref:Uncharacterized protein n=2 Tax=Lacinutrix venerupis TaxID=1486034 RepID=A0AAC9PY91_9FLAO|nr:hypothetical protein BWR22_14275 [Lacinutrix venerupis]
MPKHLNIKHLEIMNYLNRNYKRVIKNKIRVSKTSILIIATIVFSFLNVNATNLKTSINSKVNLDITTDDLIKIFDWSVKTNTGEFSGTASTLFDAKKRANMVGQGAIVLEQKIVSYYVLRSEIHSKTNRTYFWEVVSEHGYAKGFSSSEFSAKRMLHLLAKGDIVSYRIIENKIK